MKGKKRGNMVNKHTHIKQQQEEKEKRKSEIWEKERDKEKEEEIPCDTQHQHGSHLIGAAKELQQNALLDILKAVDVGRQCGGKAGVSVLSAEPLVPLRQLGNSLLRNLFPEEVSGPATQEWGVF